MKRAVSKKQESFLNSIHVCDSERVDNGGEEGVFDGKRPR